MRHKIHSLTFFVASLSHLTKHASFVDVVDVVVFAVVGKVVVVFGVIVVVIDVVVALELVVGDGY